MRLLPLPLLLLVTLIPAAGNSADAPAAAAPAGDPTLHALFDAAWERGLRENPLAASALGDHRFDMAWPDLSKAALERSHREDRATVAAVDAIDPATLTPADQLNRDMFRRDYANELDAYGWGAQLLPLDHMEGLQNADRVSELLPFATVQDYENWIARLNGFDAMTTQTIALMREGMARGLVQPCVIMQRLPAQIDKQIVADPTASPYYAPLREMPDSIPGADQARLRAAATAAIASGVVPAHRRFASFFANEYLPACRDSVGVWDTPGGEQWYRQRIRWFTTTELDADAIHEIGLREVARIREQMQAIVKRVGFDGTLEQFMQYLRTDPRFHHTDPDALLLDYMATAKRIDPMLPQIFGRLPRMPYGVRPIPEHIAPYTTTAYYQQPSMDGRRAGYYYVNLYKPEERPTWEIPVLSVHEAVPGHHLQIALAQELGELPKFRRNSEVTAFVEGWGLYSESLGEEMGLYDDPYDKFGQLTYEMWRAVRLVVDTGMHHKRWTREQAIAFFKANAAKTELDIVNEIDRYIAWPGQALAYKIGELKIKQLRSESAAALGPNFDLRAFHDVVLGSGAVPLDVLERNVTQWRLEQAKALEQPQAPQL